MANNPQYHVYIQFTPLYQGCGGFVTADLNLLFLMTLILDDSKLVDWFDVYALPGSRQTTPEQFGWSGEYSKWNKGTEHFVRHQEVNKP